MPNALDMMLTGKTIKTRKAKSMGLVDATVEPLGERNLKEFIEGFIYQKE